MVGKFFPIVFILCTLINSSLVAQKAGQPKSIHQVEWEQHRDYKISSDIQLNETQGPAVALVARQSGPSKEIFGYLPYWAYSNYPTLNYNLLTTIAYFSVETFMKM